VESLSLDFDCLLPCHVLLRGFRYRHGAPGIEFPKFCHPRQAVSFSFCSIIKALGRVIVVCRPVIVVCRPALASVVFCLRAAKQAVDQDLFSTTILLLVL
jgi:hypothetical protein